MHFSTLTLAAAIVAVLSPLVNATVYLGLRTSNDGSKSQVAYTNGTPRPLFGLHDDREREREPMRARFLRRWQQRALPIQRLWGLRIDAF
ncbi:hypothetical protein B7494_g8523 [Chlorociboria aeruginascens]|nr:hypothetical protein B7494_g8523 [Chlorociboria aeruginascens]